MRKGFYLYHTYANLFKRISAEDCAELIRALFDFSMNGAMPENLSPAADAAFAVISEEMASSFKKYDEISEKRAQSGKKGGRPAKKDEDAAEDEKAKKANAFSEKQKKQLLSEKANAFNRIEYNRVECNRVEDCNNIDYSSYSTSTQNSSSVAVATDNPVSVVETREIKEIIDAWNTLSSLGIQPIQKLMPSSKRGISLKARISEYGIDNILKAIENIRASDFLQGKNKNGWVITFDWFVLPNNFPKVLEGNYSNRSKEVESGNPFMQVLREMEAEDEQAGDY